MSTNLMDSFAKRDDVEAAFTARGLDFGKACTVWAWNDLPKIQPELSMPFGAGTVVIKAGIDKLIDRWVDAAKAAKVDLTATVTATRFSWRKNTSFTGQRVQIGNTYPSDLIDALKGAGLDPVVLMRDALLNAYASLQDDDNDND